MPTSTTALDSLNNTAANLSTSTLPSTNTSHIQTATEVSEQNRRRRRPHKQTNEENNNRAHDETEGSREGEHVGTRHRNQGRRRDDGPRHKPVGQTRPVFQEDASAQSGRSSPAKSQRAQERHGRGRGRGHGPDGLGPRQDGPPRGRGGGGRRKQINAKLTSADAENSSEKGAAPTPVRTRKRNDAAKPDTLTNRLIDSLRTPPYADCPICFNSIHPAQPIWSCSPSGQQASSSAANDSDETPGDTQCCYTPFHLKCIKSWASKSVKDLRDAYLARGETEKQGEWRCPGCQRRRLHVPSSYLCFCGSTPDPRPPRLATPHSCGNPCSRPRACSHACSLSCHPGPCPPCQITTQIPCHCGRQIKSFRCADLASLRAHGKAGASRTDLSCGNTCNKLLDCGKHRCMKACHPGNCEECPIVEEARCYCGKTSKSLRCGEGEEKHSSVVLDDGVLEEWDGRFTCENSCGRPFDCRIHMCEKPCHPPSTSPPPCSRSPSLVSHCPCGKKPLYELEGGVREKCTDPIVTCGNMCMKKLEGCNHACSVPCHTGPCPPCGISLIIPCRCGSTTRAVKCSESRSADAQEILCDKPCTALRACGRHRCNRPCCPLAVLAGGAKGKGKKPQSQLNQGLDYALGDEAHWHECDLVCGKMLGCGNHRCEERDHRGACPPCLRSSFEEMVCYCGRTVIEPPIPCGTRMSCPYPCSRPRPPCGHPKTPHTCHEDPAPCPPCPFLTEKTCACGKNQVRNIRCSQEKVSCGTACGKLLDCGFHHCERLCHSGECGTCTLICGKPRRLCLPAHHGCTASCHAPAACSEDEPCQATIILRCPCGRLQQPSMCGRSTSNPAGRQATQQLKCNNECAIAKRNARLAEALGISREVQDRDGQRPVTYSSDLTAFAHANARFCAVVEKTFADFINSDRKSQVLPHMHEARRKFVHDLASIYRMDTQMVDQEPMRSVQLIRRIDTRIPKPLLSSVSTPSLNVGKFADLRPFANSPVARPSSAAGVANSNVNSAHAQNANRGWTSVVAASGTSTAQAGKSGSAWDLPDRSAEVGHTRGASPARHDNIEVMASRIETSVRDDSVPDNWENDEV
ncbi:FAP1 [Sanghuangporus vaninii]